MHLAHGQTNWLSAPWSDEWQHHYKRISPNHSYCCQQRSSLHIQFHSDNMQLYRQKWCKAYIFFCDRRVLATQDFQLHGWHLFPSLPLSPLHTYAILNPIVTMVWKLSQSPSWRSSLEIHGSPWVTGVAGPTGELKGSNWTGFSMLVHVRWRWRWGWWSWWQCQQWRSTSKSENSLSEPLIYYYQGLGHHHHCQRLQLPTPCNCQQSKASSYSLVCS